MLGETNHLYKWDSERSMSFFVEEIPRGLFCDLEENTSN